METVFGDKKINKLDYVAAWYAKAARYIQGTDIQVGLVSTNSVCQGEQVAYLWKELVEDYGIKINFAHQSFQWNSEARGKAAVHCVIVGFGTKDKPNKKIFQYEDPRGDAHAISADNISPYLIDAHSTIVSPERKPLHDVPEMKNGSVPNDGGNLLINSRDELDELIAKNPGVEKYIRRMIGSEEFINGVDRWCLWFDDNYDPSEVRKMPGVMKRIEAVKRHRLDSRNDSVNKAASVPYKFIRTRQPSEGYIVAPGVSSNDRSYIPFGFVGSDVIASNACSMIPGGTLYHLGVMMSQMHMGWVRVVAGRLGVGYRYAGDVVYNTFPWPTVTDEKRAEIEAAAQAVLDARAQYTNCTLADLYSDATMPADLRKAHDELDRIVDRAYRPQPFPTEKNRIDHLLAMYRGEK